MLLSLLEYGLNRLPSGGKTIFNDKKFEFQISSEKKSLSDIRASPRTGFTGQRCLLANPGVLWAGTPTSRGSLPAADDLGFIQMFFH